jgi:hypothetical protein
VYAPHNRTFINQDFVVRKSSNKYVDPDVEGVGLLFGILFKEREKN